LTSARFTLRLDPDLKEWLEEEAGRRDRSAGWLAKQAIEAMRQASEAKRRLIQDAVQEADKGAFVSQQTVHAWMARWDTDEETPVPEADTFLKQG
jgi:predicted transcriptional regulator